VKRPIIPAADLASKVADVPFELTSKNFHLLLDTIAQSKSPEDF